MLDGHYDLAWTHFTPSPNVPFLHPLKTSRKFEVFWFSGGIEIEHLHEMSQRILTQLKSFTNYTSSKSTLFTVVAGFGQISAASVVMSGGSKVFCISISMLFWGLKFPEMHIETTPFITFHPYHPGKLQ